MRVSTYNKNLIKPSSISCADLWWKKGEEIEKEKKDIKRFFSISTKAGTKLQLVTLGCFAEFSHITWDSWEN